MEISKHNLMNVVDVKYYTLAHNVLTVIHYNTLMNFNVFKLYTAIY